MAIPLLENAVKWNSIHISNLFDYGEGMCIVPASPTGDNRFCMSSMIIEN